MENQTNIRFKKGDTAIITQNDSGHGFTIGEQVTILEVEEDSSDYRAENSNGKRWWVTDLDFVEIAET